jgi:hypothetical protein
MRTISYVAIIIATVSAGCFGCAKKAAPPQSAGAKLPEISSEFLKAHISFLGDDLLEGRGTGTRGYEIAARHVAAALQSYGLEPAGNNGSFFQRVPLIESTLDSSTTVLTLESPQRGKETLVFERDYVSSGNPFTPAITVSAPLVFIGYGVEAPEQQHNDYANIDVSGKIVVAMFDAPHRFESSKRAHYSSGLVKRQTAVAHGAVGFLQIASPALMNLYPWELLSVDARRDLFWVDDQGQPANAFPELRVTGWLSVSGASKMFGSVDITDAFARDAAGQPIEPRELQCALSARVASNQRHFESSNVAGQYRGAELRDQVVVYTAHLDHLGIGKPSGGDSIYNGVFDNASGVAGLLAIAKAFASLPERTRRSVLFVAVTGEELGMVGSDYYARNPTVPRTSIVANVNIDGLPMLYDFSDVVAYGFEHSSIATAVRRAAEQLHLEVSPDPFPEQTFFVRSDHYSFVKQGVPAIFATEGRKAVDPKLNTRELFDKWVATRYHRPNDDLQQPLNFSAAAKGAQFQFLLGHDLASDVNVPSWNTGDFFGKLFSRPQ